MVVATEMRYFIYDREFMTETNWTFLTNHAHVLICLWRDPELRVRDIADHVGITERAVIRILSELAESGYISVHKEGRRNSYRLIEGKRLRHPVEAGHSVDGLLELLGNASLRAPTTTVKPASLPNANVRLGAWSSTITTCATFIASRKKGR